MALRTIARWEGERPPHGKALLQLAELAQASDLNQIANVFRAALEAELLIGGVGADPELKPWIEAVSVIFRFRDNAWPLWDRLTLAVIDGIRHIAAVTDRGKPDARLRTVASRFLTFGSTTLVGGLKPDSMTSKVRCLRRARPAHELALANVWIPRFSPRFPEPKGMFAYVCTPPAVIG